MYSSLQQAIQREIFDLHLELIRIQQFGDRRMVGKLSTALPIGDGECNCSKIT